MTRGVTAGVNSDLIDARCVVESLQWRLIAIRHIWTSAEEHQSACSFIQRPPEDLDAALLLTEHITHHLKIIHSNRFDSDRVSPSAGVCPGCPTGPDWWRWPLYSAGWHERRCLSSADRWTWRAARPRSPTAPSEHAIGPNWGRNLQWSTEEK